MVATTATTLSTKANHDTSHGWATRVDYLVNTSQVFQARDILALGLDQRDLVRETVSGYDFSRLLDDRRALDPNHLRYGWHVTL